MSRSTLRRSTFLALAIAMPVAALAFAPRQSAPATGSKAAAAVPAEAAGAYTVDGVHSNAHFKVQHLGAGMFWGRFDDVKGSMSYTPGAAGTLEFDVQIPIAGIHSGNDNLDKHLLSPDFFNAKEFPEMTFKSSKAAPAEGGMWKVDGELTLLGVTKPVTAMVEFTGAANKGRGMRVGFEASFAINRSEFGMGYGVENGSLGDKVFVVVGLEGVAAPSGS
ncbi:MAG: YceI family protein [Phycisphaerales bacterium]